MSAHFPSTADFYIDGADVTFAPGSAANAQSCLNFTTVNDMVIEETETFTFVATLPEGSLDSLAVNFSDPITVLVQDDDGKSMHLVIILALIEESRSKDPFSSRNTLILHGV